MKRFVEGESRSQTSLFPLSLEDLVTEDNSVRVIDTFVEALDLDSLGFQGVNPHATGRPSYHPTTLLKIYIYGYLNRVQSSRRLERETQRNIELMWLTGRLSPDFKTIADFRKDNGKPIRRVCQTFIELCRQLNLFSKSVVAIDGSRFKAVNCRDKNFTPNKIKRRMLEVDKSITHYLRQLDTADQEDVFVSEEKITSLKEKLALMKDRLEELKILEKEILKSPDKQLSMTDPDARAMATSSKISGIVGYNVQTAVEAKNHLIVAYEVTNHGYDRDQLLNMAKKARAAMQVKNITAIADRGYYKGEEILACHDEGITTYVPKPLTSGSHSRGLFSKEDFIYIPEDDEYQCPAGERLEYRMAAEEGGLIIHTYWSSDCQTCSIKSHCTNHKERRVKRWEYEDILDDLQERMDKAPKAMQLRKETVEHPFGTIKSWMGWTHFQTKTFPKVKTEMSLHILAYNMKRVMNIIDIKPLINAIQV